MKKNGHRTNVRRLMFRALHSGLPLAGLLAGAVGIDGCGGRTECDAEEACLAHDSANEVNEVDDFEVMGEIIDGAESEQPEETTENAGDNASPWCATTNIVNEIGGAVPPMGGMVMPAADPDEPVKSISAAFEAAVRRHNPKATLPPPTSFRHTGASNEVSDVEVDVDI